MFMLFLVGGVKRKTTTKATRRDKTRTKTWQNKTKQKTKRRTKNLVKIGKDSIRQGKIGAVFAVLPDPASDPYI